MYNKFKLLRNIGELKVFKNNYFLYDNIITNLYIIGKYDIVSFKILSKNLINLFLSIELLPTDIDNLSKNILKLNLTNSNVIDIHKFPKQIQYLEFNDLGKNIFSRLPKKLKLLRINYLSIVEELKLLRKCFNLSYLKKLIITDITYKNNFPKNKIKRILKKIPIYSCIEYKRELYFDNEFLYNHDNEFRKYRNVIIVDFNFKNKLKINKWKKIMFKISKRYKVYLLN